jgi:ABC transporter, phosphonate, periplasmic substrate-binding protein
VEDIFQVREREKEMKKSLVFLLAATMFCGMVSTAFSSEILTCWFPPDWKAKTENAKSIAKALGDSGVIVRPRIAKDYPEILEAFASPKPNLVYVGSFVQAVIKARGLGTPLVQAVNGKQFYAGILVYPKGQKPEAILKQYPVQIAYAAAASSGESAAKAATGGKAAIKVASHAEACRAIEAGKAKAAFVKNWWWEANKPSYPGLDSYELPGISVIKNPDNVLTASKAVSAETMAKITKAAMAHKEVFAATGMTTFDSSNLEFSLELMRKGNIDPLNYKW